MREDLVDHRPVGPDGDGTPRAVTGGEREGIDCDDLLEQPRRCGRRLASHSAGTVAYQPEYRVVTWPVSGMWTSTRARNTRGPTVAVPAVGPSDVSERYVTAFTVRSSVSYSSAIGCRAPYRASRVATARSSAGIQRAVCTGNPECGHVSMEPSASATHRH